MVDPPSLIMTNRCGEFHVTGITSLPKPNSPELESTRLGGNAKPFPNDHDSSSESKGKQRFDLVLIFVLDGIADVSDFETKGAIEIGNSGSSSPNIRQGDQDDGLLRSLEKLV